MSCRVIMGLLEARLRISASLECIEYYENRIMDSAVDSYSLEFIVHIYIMTKKFPRCRLYKTSPQGSLLHSFTSCFSTVRNSSSFAFSNCK